MGEQTKSCTACHVEKLISCFWNHPAGKYGVESKCKSCKSSSWRRWYKGHRQERADYFRRRHAENPNRRKERWRSYAERNREKLRASYKCYYHKNKARLSEKARRYGLANRRRLVENRKRWLKARKWLESEYNRRYRARKMNAPARDLTVGQWERIKDAFRNRCAYCGCEGVRLTQDHVIPLSKGGSHTASNVVPACGPCNSGKKDRSVAEFLLTASQKKRDIISSWAQGAQRVVETSRSPSPEAAGQAERLFS